MRIVVAALLAAALLGAQTPAAGAPDPVAIVGPRRVIVGWKTQAGGVQAERALEKSGLWVAKRLYGGKQGLVEVPDGEDAEAFSRRLEALPGVAYAEPDYPVAIVWTPNDPYFNSPPPALTQWGPKRIAAEAAWDAALGTDVTIAIIDTGVDLDHPDLAGKIDTVNDFDFFNGDNEAQDDNGHGTHCAGIAAAVTNNGQGIAGMAPDATILPIKTLDSAGNGTVSTLAQGVNWAVANGAGVVSMSLGGSEGSITLETAIADAHAAGVVVVAAAGNLNTSVFYPAAYDQVIAVGATDSTDARATYSNKGAALDVMAPGGTSSAGIVSTVINGYGVKYGTSMATPHVAGTAALMRSSAPSAGPDAIADALVRTSRDIGAPGTDTLTGHGLVHAANAIVALTSDDTEPPATSVDAVATYSDVATITLAASDSGTGVAWTYFSLDGGTVSTAPSVTVHTPGLHTLDYWSVDRAGNAEAPTRVAFTVVDTLAPVTVTDAVARYTEVADVRLYSSDGGSGVASTYSRLDGGAITRDMRIIVPSVHRQGTETHTLDYWSVDRAGNVEATTTVTFDVGDYVAPVTTSNAVPVYSGHAAITLSVTDVGFGVRETHWSLDGSVPTTGTTVATSDAGDHVLAFASTDVAGNHEETRTAAFRVYGSADIKRIAASDRYGTAIALSQSAFPGGSVPVAVLASGQDFPDALTASGLAGAFGSPVLLTARTHLPGGLLAELARLGATRIVIVGGTAAVDPAVESALRAEGLTVERIAGDDRYATAAAVAGRVGAEYGAPVAGAFVARGDGFADALAVSPLAYRAGYPVLLTRGTALSAEADSAIRSLGASEVVLVGGSAALSAEVEAQVRAASAVPVTRLAGSNRYATAVTVAAFGLDEDLVAGPYIGVATGTGFPDALAGGAVAGASDGVLLLTRPGELPAEVRAFVATRGAADAPVRIFGGLATIGESVRAALASIPLI